MFGFRRTAEPVLALAALLHKVYPADGELTFAVCYNTTGAFNIQGVAGGPHARPCPAEVYAAALLAGSMLYACASNGAYVCTGDGTGAGKPHDCAPVKGDHTLGCGSGQALADLHVSSISGSRAVVYAACLWKVARCDVDTGTHHASNCVDVGKITTPSREHFGVTLSPTDKTRLLVGLHAFNVDPDAGLWSCKLTAPEGNVVDHTTPCTKVGNPCGGLTSGQYNQNTAISDTPNNVARCQYTDAGGVTHCAPLPDASPCPNQTYGVSELASGATTVGCWYDGYRVCYPAGPSAAPSQSVPGGGPTTGPTAPPSLRPSRPTAGTPTGAPLGPTARPSAVPAVPSAVPSPVPSGSSATPTVSPSSSIVTPTAPPTVHPSHAPSRSTSVAPGPPSAVSSSGAPSAPPLRGPPTFPPATTAPSAAPRLGTSAAPSATRTVAPAMPPAEDPTAGPSAAPAAGTEECEPHAQRKRCSTMRCQGVSKCREASRCISLHGGGAYCLVGRPAPDGEPCDDGRAASGPDACRGGACVGLPVGCAPSDACSLDPHPECGSYDCADGRCRRRPANEGRECNDSDPRTARDVCVLGICIGTYLCQDVECPEPPQCKQRGVCRHSDGVCVESPRPDGTPCRGLGAAAAAVSECGAGECRDYAAMRLSEVHFAAEGGAVTPVTTFAPATPFAGARAACSAADGSVETDWVDKRVASLSASELALAGDGEVVLAALAGASHGGLVFLFAAPTALRELRIANSPRSLEQAPVRVNISGCVLRDAAAERLARLAPLCGTGAGQGGEPLLGALQREFAHAGWAQLPAERRAEASATPSQVYRINATARYLCYRVVPAALQGGCGTGCIQRSAVVVFVTSGVGATTLAIVASAGVLLGLAVGCRIGKPDSTEPPPLVGKDLEEVLTQCLDAHAVLSAHWWRHGGSLADALSSVLVVPPGRTAVAQLRAMLRQPWRADAAGHPQVGSLPESVLAALRLYSQEPQDHDREMGWEDAPPPGKDSAGHGMPGEHDAGAWDRYIAAQRGSGGARNQSAYRMPNLVCIRLSADPRLSALEGAGGWVHFVAAASWAASRCRPEAAPAGGSGAALELTRMLGNLPAHVRSGYAALRVGHCFATPCLSSTSVTRLADPTFMGPHPGYAVLLRLRFDEQTAVGVDMRPVSMYPDEEEVLLPLFTVFRVLSVLRPRGLHGLVALSKPNGWRERAARGLLRARAAARPLLVVEAECVGHLGGLDAGAAKWHAAVGRDAEAASAELRRRPPEARLSSA
eukprot:TRINITY_DN11731_c0_g1_i4.p1 TRINITY_DN11731_c0_g1~~TRINITY_DN11731_c0_g1_i4.p1  ORF type:complete len:1266 (+),score=146.56 TRINITY_DN11731_c0_g1_i4:69-3866(+)